MSDILQQLAEVCKDAHPNLETFQQLLVRAKEQGVDINQRINEIDGETLLHLAARNDNLIIVQDLLMGTGKEAGFTAINEPDECGRTSLMLSCISGHDLVVEELVAEGKAGRQAGVDVTMTTKGGSTALHCATLTGGKNCVRILLSCTKPEDKKALIRAVVGSGRTALHDIEFDDQEGGTGETVTALIEGMDDEEDRRWIVNALDNDGETALFEVARWCKAGTIPKLLEMGRQYGRGEEDGGGEWGDRRNLEGMTALHTVIFLNYETEETALLATVSALLCPKGKEDEARKWKTSTGDAGGGGEGEGEDGNEEEVAAAMMKIYDGGVDVNVGCSKRTGAMEMG